MKRETPVQWTCPYCESLQWDFVDATVEPLCGDCLASVEWYEIAYDVGFHDGLEENRKVNPFEVAFSREQYEMGYQAGVEAR